MLLSVEQKAESIVFMGKFDDAAKMIKSTVKLEGTGPPLKASGVIFNFDDSGVEILTAAHNMLVWKGLDLPPNDWTQLSADFAAGLIVHYNPQGSQFNAATTQSTEKGDVTKVIVPDGLNGCGQRAACYYDVAVIRCENQAFLTFAKDVLGAQYDLEAEAKSAVSKAEKFLNRELYVLAQLGYGKKSDSRAPQTIVKKNQKDMMSIGTKIPVQSGPPENEMADYNIQYRVTLPLQAQYVCVYDQIGEDDKPPAYCENSNAIQIKGSIASSSAEGDSGGPVYAIVFTKVVTKDPNFPDDRKKDKVKRYFGEASLIGVTTGSDMKTGKEAPGNPYFNDVATSVIPYLASRIEEEE